MSKIFTAFKIFFFALAAAFFCGCSIENIPGEYSGIIPVASTKIKVDLRLNPDYTIKIKTRYPKNINPPTEYKGFYRVKKVNSEKIIALNYYGDGIKFLKLQENGDLKVLTVKKQEVKGPQSGKYILKKKTNLYF